MLRYLHPLTGLSAEIAAVLGKGFSTCSSLTEHHGSREDDPVQRVDIGVFYRAAANPTHHGVMVFHANEETAEAVALLARDWLAVGRSLPEVWFAGDEARAA
jgi:hypothetical protein